MVVDEVERMETGPLEIVRAGENDADLVAIMVHRLLHEIGAWHGAPDDERIHAVCRQLLEEDNQFSALLAFDMERRPVGVMTLTEAVAIYAEGRLGIIMELYLSLMHSCRCRRSTPCWYLLLLYHYKTNNHTYTRHSH